MRAGRPNGQRPNPPVCREGQRACGGGESAQHRKPAGPSRWQPELLGDHRDGHDRHQVELIWQKWDVVQLQDHLRVRRRLVRVKIAGLGGDQLRVAESRSYLHVIQAQPIARWCRASPYMSFHLQPLQLGVTRCRFVFRADGSQLGSQEPLARVTSG
jgi:hypothetical protein